MKKILFTSALVGSVVLAGSAMAAAPQVKLGGHISFEAAHTDQDNDTGVRDIRSRNNTEVHINVEGKADSGLIYGATIELEADVNAADDNEGLNADKTFIYLQDDFGRVELGANGDAAAALGVSAASVARATGGIDGSAVYYINTTGIGSGTFILAPDLPTADAAGVIEDANKITYYSPRFSGLQLGVSFTPDQGDVGTASGFSTDADANNYENVFNLGVNYTADYEGVAVEASATGEFGENETAAREDLSAWALGLKLGYENFSIAGSYADWDESNQTVGSNQDSDLWSIGAAYEQGPAAVSVTYLDSEFGANEYTHLSIGADYQLAAGLVPFVEVNFFDLESGTTSNDGTVVLVGTHLDF
jgi:predicted porin